MSAIVDQPRGADAAADRTLSVRDFPTDFRWGCATSAYQIEGAVTEDGRGESIWDRFCARQGAVRDRSSGAIACDHYHRWSEDLDLAASLGINAYRFSIAWPRVFPPGVGPANQRGLDFYSRLVDGLLERGIEPWVTLYHWDLPQTLQERGGWLHRDTCQAFADYADRVSRHLGDRVRHWITHNEPWCSAFVGHLEGVHAPGVRSLRSALQAAHHVLLSHGMAVPALRRNVSRAQVGIALSLHPLRAASDTAADRAAMQRHDGLRNRWFLDPLYFGRYPEDAWAQSGADVPKLHANDLAIIAVPTDYLGVNYYFPEVVADDPSAAPFGARVVQPAGLERTAFGWEVAPGALAELLQRIHREYAPRELLVTENGASYDDNVGAGGEIHDVPRRDYLERHVRALHEVVVGGLPVRGYFVWSLLDNFEWSEGYTRRFGLVHVDFATQQRRLKQSGQWYRNFLRGAR